MVGLALDRDESGIGRAVDFIDRSDAGDAAERVALGVDGPDLAGKAQGPRAADRDLAFMAADEGDGLGRKQAGEGCGHEFEIIPLSRASAWERAKGG